MFVFASPRHRIDVQHHADRLLVASVPVLFGFFRRRRRRRRWRRRRRCRRVGHGVTDGARGQTVHHVGVRLHGAAGRGRVLLRGRDVRRGDVDREAGGITGVAFGRLHEVVRERRPGWRQVHRRAELVAEPLGVALGRRHRVRQELVDLLRRPDGHVPQTRLLRHHVVVPRRRRRLRRRLWRRLRRSVLFAAGRTSGHVLHQAHDALRRERRPVRGQLREVRPPVEPVNAVRIILQPAAPVGRRVRRVCRVRRGPPVVVVRAVGRVRRPPGRSPLINARVSHRARRFVVTVADVVAVGPLRPVVGRRRVVLRVFHGQHRAQEPVRRPVRRVAARGRRLFRLHVLRVTHYRPARGGRGGLSRGHRVIEEHEVHLNDKNEKIKQKINTKKNRCTKYQRIDKMYVFFFSFFVYAK